MGEGAGTQGGLSSWDRKKGGGQELSQGVNSAIQLGKECLSLSKAVGQPGLEPQLGLPLALWPLANVDFLICQMV